MIVIHFEKKLTAAACRRDLRGSWTAYFLTDIHGRVGETVAATGWSQRRVVTTDSVWRRAGRKRARFVKLPALIIISLTHRD